jgi:hypothetical protein
MNRHVLRGQVHYAMLRVESEVKVERHRESGEDGSKERARAPTYDPCFLLPHSLLSLGGLRPVLPSYGLLGNFWALLYDIIRWV